MTTTGTTTDAAPVDSTLAALADPNRRRVVGLLAEGPRSAGALAAAVGLTPPAMSRHLRVLRRTGIVHERPDSEDARVRVYHLRPERLTDLQDWLDEVRQFWSGQLEAFKEHVENR
jgi:DNA-binding transcriptional ArsR family regulator